MMRRDSVITIWLFLDPLHVTLVWLASAFVIAWAIMTPRELAEATATAYLGVTALAMAECIVCLRDRRLRVLLDHVPLVAAPTSPTPAGLELDTGPGAFTLLWHLWPPLLRVAAAGLWIDTWAATGALWAIVLVGIVGVLLALVYWSPWVVRIQSRRRPGDR